jgi:hypothetical protein
VALAQVRAHGLQPADIACVPAAAGGPKGLALIALDRWLFGEWLRDATAIELVGASIGAWRMAAAAQADPRAALDRLAEGYVAQRFPRQPTPATVSAECRRLAARVLDGAASLAPRPGVTLSVITARARGVLAASASKPAFLQAAAANALSRRRLAAHLERVVFTHGDSPLWRAPFDEFGHTRGALDAHNTEDALLASGSIPVVCDPVHDPAGAPRGRYWDGGLIDYHLWLPYPRLAGDGTRRRLVLYPHFVPHVTPGWLDKHLPWRRHPRGHTWLDTMLLLAPSRAFLHRLPQRRLPDRNDFYRYGEDNAGRIRDWRAALAECERFAEQAARWLQAPDPALLRPL